VCSHSVGMVVVGVHAREMASATSFSRLYICPWPPWRLPERQWVRAACAAASTAAIQPPRALQRHPRSPSAGHVETNPGSICAREGLQLAKLGCCLDAPGARSGNAGLRRPIRPSMPGKVAELASGRVPGRGKRSRLAAASAARAQPHASAALIWLSVGTRTCGRRPRARPP